MNSGRKRLMISGVAMIVLILSVPAVAQEQKVKDYEIAVAKGTVQLESGNFRSAIELFEKAVAVQPNDKIATRALGVAYARAGDLEKAKETLLRGLTLDPADARTRYELGVVMYKLGEKDEARDLFTAVAEQSSDNALRSASKQYRDLAAGGKEEARKKLILTLIGGLQYDTNVILEPDNPGASTNGKKADWRGVISFDGNYQFLHDGKTTADAGYLFYQSLHKDLNAFNVQQHSLKLAAGHDRSETARLGLLYQLSYALVDGDHYSTVHQIIPSAIIRFSPASQTDLHLAYEKKKYVDSVAFPVNSPRSGNNTALGIAHTVRTSKVTAVNAGYDLDVDSADQKFWSYTGHKVRAGLQTALGSYTIAASASYYDRKYDDVMPGFTEKRHDGVQEFSVSFTRNITGHIDLVLSDSYTINDSNLIPYQYTRNIAGIFMVTRL